MAKKPDSGSINEVMNKLVRSYGGIDFSSINWGSLFLDPAANTNYWSDTSLAQYRHDGHYGPIALTKSSKNKGKFFIPHGATAPSFFADMMGDAKSEIFDPVSNSWHSTADTSVPSFLHMAIEIDRGPDNGKVWIACGLDAPGVAIVDFDTFYLLLDPGEQGLSSIRLYNPDDDTWEVSETSFPKKNIWSKVLRLKDGRLLIIGGFDEDSVQLDGDNIVQLNATAKCYLYNPYTRAVTETGEMSVGRFGFGASVMQDGRVIVVGGGSTTFSPATSPGLGLTPPTYVHDTVEIFNPATGIWSDGADPEVEGTSLTMPTISDETSPMDPPADYPIEGGIAMTGADRFGPGCVTLMDGRVLIIGGEGSNELYPDVTGSTLPRATCLIYDPRSGTFTQTAFLPGSGRSDVATVTLHNGMVFTAGGPDETFTRNINNVNLFDPHTETWIQGPSLPSAGVVETFLGDFREEATIDSSGSRYNPTITLNSKGDAVLMGLGYGPDTEYPDGIPNNLGLAIFYIPIK
jgi:hypothetical protein